MKNARGSTEAVFIICVTIVLITIIAALWTGNFFAGARKCRDSCGSTRMAEWADYMPGAPEHCKCSP